MLNTDLGCWIPGTTFPSHPFARFSSPQKSINGRCRVHMLQWGNIEVQRNCSSWCPNCRRERSPGVFKTSSVLCGPNTNPGFSRVRLAAREPIPTRKHVWAQMATSTQIGRSSQICTVDSWRAKVHNNVLQFIKKLFHQTEYEIAV